MDEENGTVLAVDDLVTGYGRKQVLDGVCLKVDRGEIVAVIGHNGAGKSTLLRTTFGLLPVWKGQIRLDGRALIKPTPQQLLRKGVAYVPQGNRVFSDLTVRENLEVGGVMLDKPRRAAGLERVCSAFPQLQPRMRQRAGTLSGGEKQMLALANALMIAPRLLLLDEPSLGLAPPLVTEALDRIREICLAENATAVVVEQKVRSVLKIADRVYVLRNGSVSFTGDAAELDDDRKLKAAYL